MAGKVVLITGAARGQGRSHAVRLAEEGADIVALDICGQIDSTPIPLATGDDLEETGKLVENLGRKALTFEADVRDDAALAAAVEGAVREFGHLDVICANAGIASVGTTWELSDEAWNDTLDVNLTGVWRTCKAAIPQLVEQGTGGSIVITSSVAGMVGLPGLAPYTAAKTAVIGLMRTLANELAPHRIRVNTIHPTTVETDMIRHPTFWSLLGVPGMAEGGAIFEQQLNPLQVPWMEPRDVSNAVLWLASDEARYVTGVTLNVDAGYLNRP